ncbi:MAG: hypothetical protein JWN46_2825 [Acidimicrobiales bacterium]|nr:hypothetical protein [Acidimicrobiales bacterium]
MHLELRSSIDRRDACLTWRDGVLEGDEEFLARIRRLAAVMDVDLGAASETEVIRLARHALGAPVVVAEITPP